MSWLSRFRSPAQLRLGPNSSAAKLGAALHRSWQDAVLQVRRSEASLEVLLAPEAPARTWPKIVARDFAVAVPGDRRRSVGAGAASIRPIARLRFVMHMINDTLSFASKLPTRCRGETSGSDQAAVCSVVELDYYLRFRGAMLARALAQRSASASLVDPGVDVCDELVLLGFTVVGTSLSTGARTSPSRSSRRARAL